MKIYPKTKEVERLFRRLVKNRIDYTDDITFTRNLGRWYPEIFNNGFLDIGRIDRRRESMIALRPNVIIAPVENSGSRSRRFCRFEFFKIF